MAYNKKIGETAESVLQLAEKFQAIISMAEVLKGFSSVEQTIEETKTALTHATADRDAMQKEAKKAEARLVDLRAEQKKTEEEHKTLLEDRAAASKKAADEEARKILGVASRQALDILETAKSEGDAIRAANEKANDIAQERLKKAQSETKELEEQLVSMREEYADLDRKLGDLKKLAASIAG